MMNAQLNSVLKDFMDLRKSLHRSPAPTSQVKAHGKDKALGKTKEAQLSETLETSLARIIEDKPHKREVCEYFQKECDRLTAKKMA